MQNTRQTRLHVFIEGAHLFAINDFYRFDIANNEWHIDWSHFMIFLRNYYADMVDVDVSTVSIPECHVFLGLDDAKEAEQVKPYFGKMGIKLHHSPRRLSHSKVHDSFGADVNMAVYALEHAYKNAYDVAVLLTGSSAFMSLAWSIKRAGKKVMVPFWNQLRINDQYDRRVMTSPSLIRAADFPINMRERIARPIEKVSGLLTKDAWLPEVAPRKLLLVEPSVSNA